MSRTETEAAALAASIDEAEARWLQSWIAGPAVTGWQAVPPQAGDVAPDAQLDDHTGTPRTLASFWQERPALVLFWRHFGCGCGVDRAARLKEEAASYREVGLEIVIVGQGDPLRAAAYRDEHALDATILCDTTLEVYRTYGLVDASVSQVLFDAPEQMWSHDRASGEAFITQRRTMGRPLVDNPWMLPGEFVIDTAAIIHHAHRYQHCEDFPDPRVHLAAAKLAGPTSAS